MCGRYTLKTDAETLERIFGHPVPTGYQPRYNIAPAQQVLTILAEGDEVRPAMLRWGLIPFWADDPAIGNRMINARAESVAEKPAFRNAFRKRRCVVLADGFYEWQKRPDGKRPLWIRTRDEQPFAFAGLWERWDRGADPIESCTILTRDASPFMRDIHHRMPVVLDAAAVNEWLSPEADDGRLQELINSAETMDFQAHEVSTLVNSPTNDLPECLDPVEEEAPTLALPGFE